MARDVVEVDIPGGCHRYPIQGRSGGTEVDTDGIDRDGVVPITNEDARGEIGDAADGARAIGETVPTALEGQGMLGPGGEYGPVEVEACYSCIIDSTIIIGL